MKSLDETINTSLYNSYKIWGFEYFTSDEVRESSKTIHFKYPIKADKQGIYNVLLLESTLTRCPNQRAQ